MAIRRILQLGDPLLRVISNSVADPLAAQPVLDDLRDTLHEFQRTHGFGRGISAIQIGEPLRVIYIEFGGASYSLVNPVFTGKSQERFRLWDDCFSFPGLLVYLERHHSASIRYQDEHGATRELSADSALSELLQHEMDHLDGILAIDRRLGDCESLATREEWERRLRRPAHTSGS